MSITLGIYDVFSYAIPGFLYLFVFNEALKLLQLPSLDFSKLDSLAYFVSFGLLSYLIGHLFDQISYYIWYRIFYRRQAEERAYKKFQGLGIKADFDPSQWAVMFGLLRQNNFELGNSIDKNKAISIMLRNVSFGLFVLAVISMYETFANGFSLISLLSGVVALVGSVLSLRRSDMFNLWFYLMIYEQSVTYGSNLKEILETNKKIKGLDNKRSSITSRSRLEK